MSRNLHIICEDCKEHLWVGQGAKKFYSGEPETMKALGEFLFKHENHNLGFHDDDKNPAWYDDVGWSDVTNYS